MQDCNKQYFEFSWRSMARIGSRRSNIIVHIEGLLILFSIVISCNAAPVQSIIRDTVQTAIPGSTNPPTQNGSHPTCNVRRESLNTTNLEQRYDAIKEFYRMNNYLTYEQVKDVYEPSCLTGTHVLHKFAEVQCFIPKSYWDSNYPVQFCWCAEENTGLPINITTSSALSEEHIQECGPPKSCIVNGQELPHGNYTEDSCLKCVCFNGDLKNCLTICEDDDNMTAFQLDYLKRRLLKKIYIDWRHRNSQVNPGDLDYTALVEQLSDKEAFDKAEEILRWKFTKLDVYKKTTHLLYKNLRLYVHYDVKLFTSSSDFQRRFPSILDINGNRLIEVSEWTGFFTSENDTLYLNRINNNTIFPGSGSGFGK